MLAAGGRGGTGAGGRGPDRGERCLAHRRDSSPSVTRWSKRTLSSGRPQSPKLCNSVFHEGARPSLPVPGVTAYSPGLRLVLKGLGGDKRRSLEAFIRVSRLASI